jgi:hypothetical protein
MLGIWFIRKRPFSSPEQELIKLSRALVLFILKSFVLEDKPIYLTSRSRSILRELNYAALD